MSWDDCRQRREAIRAALAFAELNPQADIPVASLPAVSAVFADRRELLLALHYDWQQVLWAQLDLLSLDTAGNPRSAEQICARAWEAATALRPTLRRVLDRHGQECTDARCSARQDSLLVSAGIGHHCSPRSAGMIARAA